MDQFGELTLEQWPLERLVPYARNPRRNDDVIDRMCAAIREFGFRIPVVARSDGTVVDGHLRLKAAKQLELESVPVVLADDLTETQIKAFRILANQSANWAEWDNDLLSLELTELQDADFDLDMIGFSNEELSDLLQPLDEEGESGSGSFESESVPEPPANPVTQPGDLWILGEHRLLCGSSLNPEDVIRLMNGERAILFATDPPYLVDYDGTNHPGSKESRKRESLNKDWSGSYGVTWDDSSQGPELYEGFIRATIDHAIQPNAAWYCWHASKRQAMLEAVWEKAGAFQHQQIIWNKEKGVLTRSKFLWKHEPCLMGWIKGNMPPKVADAEFLSTVWDIQGLSGEERPDHPTPKPLECFAIPMRQHVERGGLCYEPFSGSGSQIMAGEMTGRRVNAMEISPVYVDVAVKRFIQATGKIVYLDGSGGKSFEDMASEREIDLNE
ncbi:DNA modification methylase [Magnetococcus sp. PR-3]|uniref:DNA modification methylase n=1 Tax=Magnetococcus sp. PR-3 TaxID=3120355 RepID=UPI002FCDEFB6